MLDIATVSYQGLIITIIGQGKSFLPENVGEIAVFTKSRKFALCSYRGIFAKKTIYALK